MDEFFIALLGIFFEIVIELVGEAALDLVSRVAADVFKPKEAPCPVASWFAYAVLER
jgi:hypothetical protein